jgi:hypothetical protein
VGTDGSTRQPQRRRAFDRRSWQRHPVLAGLRALGALGVAIVGLISAFGYDGHPPGWLIALFFLCLIGSSACWVLLLRRDDG